MRYLHFLLFFCLLGCSGQQFQKEKLVFELRLVETDIVQNRKMMTLYKSNELFSLQDSVLLDNKDIASTSVKDIENRSVVEVVLTNDGREKFAMITEEFTGQRLGIMVDGILVSAPKVNDKITQGKLIIIGYFSSEEAGRIAKGISVH